MLINDNYLWCILAIKYKISVETGTNRYAGTDANVFITLYGYSGSSLLIPLSSDKNIFEKGE
jgi:hypothetical protein